MRVRVADPLQSAEIEDRMTRAAAPSTVDRADAPYYEVVIIGAGVTGLSQLHALREHGVSVRLLEAGGGIGGTWYWNRYPGCRLDSESYTYQYAFDDDLLDSTVWTEVFAGQAELERYYNGVADRFGLREDIQCDTRVQSMVFDEQTHSWTLHTEAGELFRAHVVITATGILSAPNFPSVPGREKFRGEFLHTSLWPQEPVDFTGKRVAVIGTGATGIQIIPQVAKTAGELTVFQRTPNWAVPLRNRPIAEDEMGRIKADYPAIFDRLRSTSNGFLHDWDPASVLAMTPEERIARFELAWSGTGFTKWFGLNREIATSMEANRLFCDFVASKIRSRVDDPAVAAKLIPTDHLFGTKRVPCETEYFETYNRDNVTLVSLADDPILEYTEKGLRTAQGELELDMIVLATGFDAFTGALSRIDIRGVEGLSLQDKWKDGPKTFLGLQVHGFPNLIINGGPHGKGGVGNSPRCSEPVIPWIVELLRHMADNGLQEIEADADAEATWTDSVYASTVGTLAEATRSYSFGDNVPGKPRVYLAFTGTLPDFVQQLKQIEADGYPGFHLS